MSILGTIRRQQAIYAKPKEPVMQDRPASLKKNCVHQSQGGVAEQQIAGHIRT